MDYELSDAHKLIRDTSRRIAREKVAPRSAELDESGEYPEDIFQIFAQAGLLGLTIPEKYGGAGAGFLALALAVEETAKHDNACSLILLLSALSTQPINLGGSEEQKHEWLSKSAAGAIKGAFCLTEPNTGSDAQALESRARRDGDDYVINGEKMYISGGNVANYVCYFAQTGDNGTGISAFIVPSDSPGFSVPGCDRKMGVIGVPTANIVLQDCRVPTGLRIGDEGRGFKT
ncbi:MAG: acyl-CoA dehydrogenase family protein, partial [Dehalococcoidia bacterium]